MVVGRAGMAWPQIGHGERGGPLTRCRGAPGRVWVHVRGRRGGRRMLEAGHRGGGIDGRGLDLGWRTRGDAVHRGRVLAREGVGVVRGGLGGIRGLRDGRGLGGVVWVGMLWRVLGRGGGGGGGEGRRGWVGWRGGVVVGWRGASAVLRGRVLEEIRDIHEERKNGRRGR